jgi:Phosphomannomutase
MGKYFGTDGIRGKSSEFDNELVSKIANSVIDYLEKKKSTDEIVLLAGGDTRKSSEKILEIISSVCEKRKIKFINVEVLPTPAISMISKLYKYDIAFVVTASHNPSTDNGIKLISSTGEKISNEVINEVEYLMDNVSYEMSNGNTDKVSSHKEAKDFYLSRLVNYVDQNLEGLKIGLDCANGATSVVAKEAFESLKATVVTINDDSSYGDLINANCGSTHLEASKRLMEEKKLDIVAAFDGDGDRCLLIDNTGTVVDGDHMIGIIASELKEQNKLNSNTLVTTIMANPGLHQFASKEGIKVVITDVGDSNVQAAMAKDRLSVGGEQSGHIILDGEPTGDGILTAIFIAYIMKKNGKTLSDLASLVKKYPQIIHNMHVAKEDKELLKNDKVKELINKYKEVIESDNGQINVRPSGTEGLIRITMWGKDNETIETLSKKLADEMEQLFKEIKGAN